MPYKHQTESYRTRRGVRFECWGDSFSRDSAHHEVRTLRGQGYGAFVERQNGFWRIFVTKARTTP